MKWILVLILLLLVMCVEVAAVAWNVGWQRGVRDGKQWGYEAARDSCAMAEARREADRYYYGAP